LRRRPAIATVERLMNETRDALAFEEAIDRIVAGQAAAPGGSAPDRHARGKPHERPDLAARAGLWHWLPGLAAPMLRWRRRAHRRGGTRGAPSPSFLETES
jgi:hypothetical protein